MVSVKHFKKMVRNRKVKRVGTQKLINMKQKLTILAALLVAFTLVASCGKKATEYDSLIKEYKKVLCINMDQNNHSMSEKTQALTRQLELNKEYEEAIKTLSTEEKSKLMMNWANALAEVSEGKCD